MNKLIKTIWEIYKVIFKTVIGVLVVFAAYGSIVVAPLVLGVVFSYWWFLLWFACPLWWACCKVIGDWLYDKFDWSLENWVNY